MILKIAEKAKNLGVDSLFWMTAGLAREMTQEVLLEIGTVIWTSFRKA